MDEAVLHRLVGSEDIRYRQLVHLAEQGQRSHIRIQVVPASRAGNAGHVGGFTIASLDDADVLLMGAVRDTTDRDGVMLNLTAEAWETFTASLK